MTDSNPTTPEFLDVEQLERQTKNLRTLSIACVFNSSLDSRLPPGKTKADLIAAFGTAVQNTDRTIGSARLFHETGNEGHAIEAIAFYNTANEAIAPYIDLIRQMNPR